MRYSPKQDDFGTRSKAYYDVVSQQSYRRAPDDTELTPFRIKGAPIGVSRARDY